MHQIGLGGDTVELIGSGGIGIVQFIAVVPAILFIDRLGELLEIDNLLVFLLNFLLH